MGIGAQLIRRKPIESPEAASHGLVRSIGTLQLSMLGVGATIGTGVFFVLNQAVPLAGPAVLVSFLVAGLAAGLAAICYAELASMIPASGSTYSYAYATLGELAAMGIAGCLLLEYGVSTAAVAVGWSGYVDLLVFDVFGVHLPPAILSGPWDGGVIDVPALVLVAMCGLLLVRGGKESAVANAVMVFTKLAVLAFFAVLAFTAFQADRFADFAPNGLGGITAAAGIIFFTFIGLDAVSTAGGEARDPQRTLPRAIIIALVTVVAVYIVVAVAGLGAQPWQDFAVKDQETAGLAIILQDVVGATWPGIVLAIGAIVSIVSVTLVTLYGSSRILFTMSTDGLAPRIFGRLRPGGHTPVAGVAVVASVVGLLAAFVPMSALWDVVSIGTLFAFITVSIGVIVLRRRSPELPRGFRVPGYPVTPVLAIAACVYVLTGLHWVTFVAFGCWIAVVLAYYLVWARRRSRLGATPEA